MDKKILKETNGIKTQSILRDIQCFILTYTDGIRKHRLSIIERQTDGIERQTDGIKRLSGRIKKETKIDGIMRGHEDGRVGT